jgi:hypothetical protein
MALAPANFVPDPFFVSADNGTAGWNGRERGLVDKQLDRPAADQCVSTACSAASRRTYARMRSRSSENTVDDAELLAADLAWPTVEAVAVLLRRVSQGVLAALPCAPDARVGRVFVRETHLNTATYGPVDAT